MTQGRIPADEMDAIEVRVQTEKLDSETVLKAIAAFFEGDWS